MSPLDINKTIRKNKGIDPVRMQAVLKRWDRLRRRGLLSEAGYNLALPFSKRLLRQADASFLAGDQGSGRKRKR
jgi:hypothetical protein